MRLRGPPLGRLGWRLVLMLDMDPARMSVQAFVCCRLLAVPNRFFWFQLTDSWDGFRLFLVRLVSRRSGFRVGHRREAGPGVGIGSSRQLALAYDLRVSAASAVCCHQSGLAGHGGHLLIDRLRLLPQHLLAIGRSRRVALVPKGLKLGVRRGRFRLGWLKEALVKAQRGGRLGKAEPVRAVRARHQEVLCCNLLVLLGTHVRGPTVGAGPRPAESIRRSLFGGLVGLKEDRARDARLFALEGRLDGKGTLPAAAF